MLSVMLRFKSCEKSPIKINPGNVAFSYTWKEDNILNFNTTFEVAITS
jgi:hypothetical protein